MKGVYFLFQIVFKQKLVRLYGAKIRVSIAFMACIGSPSLAAPLLLRFSVNFRYFLRL
jgi:hypothetical protein